MSSHNLDGTINENGEGTLTKCDCGNEFFLSFRNGFKCEACRNKVSDSFKKKYAEVTSWENLKKMAREIDAKLQRQKQEDNTSNDNSEQTS